MNEDRSANPVDRRIGQRMRGRRLELGMSQEHLADMLGVTFQQVQKYEKGINRVAASRLFELGAALNVPVGYFFEGLALGAATGVSEEETAVFDAIASPEGLQLLTMFAGIKSARLRRRIVELVRVLVEDDQAALDEPG